MFGIQIEIPELCVLAMIGISGSGKTTFCEKHFKPTEVLSSDHYRALVSDDDCNQEVSEDAFDAMFYVAGKRLDHKRLVVIDATNLSPPARRAIISLARSHNTSVLALVINTPEEICRERNGKRVSRVVDPLIITKQTRQLQHAFSQITSEGFDKICYISDPDEPVEIVRAKLACNKRSELGPFDIIGDIHGCYDELLELLVKLGYSFDQTSFSCRHPLKRKAVFLGDLCETGKKNVKTLQLVMSMADDGSALSVCGPSDLGLQKALRLKIKRADKKYADIISQLNKAGGGFAKRVKLFLESLPSHYELDEGKLVVAHAGIPEHYHGRLSTNIKSFCLHGSKAHLNPNPGEPGHIAWPECYKGKSLVVYGHAPVPAPIFWNNTLCIDTGCAIGGKLTAYRYPEGELISVPALDS